MQGSSLGLGFRNTRQCEIDPCAQLSDDVTYVYDDVTYVPDSAKSILALNYLMM